EDGRELRHLVHAPAAGALQEVAQRLPAAGVEPVELGDERVQPGRVGEIDRLVARLRGVLLARAGQAGDVARAGRVAQGVELDPARARVEAEEHDRVALDVLVEPLAARGLAEALHGHVADRAVHREAVRLLEPGDRLDQRRADLRARRADHGRDLLPHVARVVLAAVEADRRRHLALAEQRLLLRRRRRRGLLLGPLPPRRVLRLGVARDRQTAAVQRRRLHLVALGGAREDVAGAIRLDLHRLARGADLELGLHLRRRGAALLGGVRQLVADELVPLAGAGRELAGAEEDVVSDGEGARPHRRGSLRRLGVGVHAHAGQVAEAGRRRSLARAAVERAARLVHRAGERLLRAAAGAAGGLRLAPGAHGGRERRAPRVGLGHPRRLGRRLRREVVLLDLDSLGFVPETPVWVAHGRPRGEGTGGPSLYGDGPRALPPPRREKRVSFRAAGSGRRPCIPPDQEELMRTSRPRSWI